MKKKYVKPEVKDLGKLAEMTKNNSGSIQNDTLYTTAS